MLNRCIIFTSKTCKDCFALSSNYQQLESMFPQVKFEYIDVTINQQLAIEHKIYTVPSIEVYDDEQLVAEFKHGNNKQFTHIVNFIKVQIELRKEIK